MINNILQYIIRSKEEGKKLLAVLLDPDKVALENVGNIIGKINGLADFIFVGGSTVPNGKTDKLAGVLKEYTKIPLILFPGDYTQITPKADAILFLSLLSGDNPEYLIKQQLKSIPGLKNSGLEIIPTGYLLIDGATETSVQKVSNTRPIPIENIELATHTALAGMYMGKQLIYLEAGSGAKHPVSEKMIAEVAKNISVPLIVGGGIRGKQQLENAFNAGADLVVIGTAFEEDQQFFDTL